MYGHLSKHKVQTVMSSFGIQTTFHQKKNKLHIFNVRMKKIKLHRYSKNETKTNEDENAGRIRLL